ncbi:MAG: hypothetical protein OXE79_04005 [Acidimicrobiaceae bacterium]|nr:hypothetical protein [Acidimicrobiaceae bacterium]MCY4176484.1 hypothetical protein [Acidimicrobiaceae bacterium]MCY4279781.1 hypothetical protein [Acidimicrobiaceae bacterium]MCY4294503.1 hypothetical protein [Acidimicrobiaceae bacterium]
MSESNTLLAHLVSNFPGRTEDIASEALLHIFNHCDACMDALNVVAQSGVSDIEPIATVKSQVVGAEGTRPDLVGFIKSDAADDQLGQERLLIEVKFWAKLTSRQPNAYIRRLPADAPAAVMFLVPDSRVRSLWPQLMQRLNGEFGAMTEVEAERRCVRIGDTKKHLMIASWGSLLDAMAARAADSDDAEAAAEIRLLRSLARYADGGFSLPDGDPDPMLRQYQRLVDDATAEGVSQGWADRKRLRAAPRHYGFGRFIRLHGNELWFGIHTELFEDTGGSTPIWVGRWEKFDDEPGVSREIGSILQIDPCKRDGRYWFPINPEPNIRFPQSLNGVIESLERYAEALRAAREAVAPPPARGDES